MTLEDFKIIEVKEHGAGYFRYDSASSNYSNYIGFGLYCSPTYNCQNFSIGNFGSILNKCKTDEIHAFCKLLSKGRRILLIDLYEHYDHMVKQAFKDCTFIVDQPYTSTNGSKMHLYYIIL